MLVSYTGFFQSENFSVYYSGDVAKKIIGAAFIVNKKLVRAMENSSVSDRIIRIHAKALSITVIQVYVPTTATTKLEIEDFLCHSPRNPETNAPKKHGLHTGQRHAKVGKQMETGITGSFGLDERIEAGDCLILFCQENRLRVINTWLKQCKCRLYTWTS